MSRNRRSGDRTRPGSSTGRAVRAATRPDRLSQGPALRGLRPRHGAHARCQEARRENRRGDRPAAGRRAPAPYWTGLSRDEHAQQPGALRERVEQVARVQFPAYMAKVPACREAHPEACWELANLMAERGRIYGDPDNRDLQGALWWFERWFPVV